MGDFVGVFDLIEVQHGREVRLRAEEEARRYLGVREPAVSPETSAEARGYARAIEDAVKAIEDTDVATSAWCGQTQDDGRQTLRDAVAAVRRLKSGQP